MQMINECIFLGSSFRFANYHYSLQRVFGMDKQLPKFANKNNAICIAGLSLQTIVGYTF